MLLAIADAFTAKAFSGNPAAVVVLDGARDASWMQDVAREMNLSETAFVAPGDDVFGLRWFTPAVEVDLCGHATLASAHVLWEQGLANPEQAIAFQTRSGRLSCRRRTDRIELDFPQRPVTETKAPPDLAEAVGARPRSVWRSEAGYLLELDSEEQVRGLRPDFPRLAAVPDGWTCVTAPASTGGFDFVSRFFAPQAGIDEDPVTGAAHCMLADFWSRRTGRMEFRAYQCSARGGVVTVRLQDGRVHLGGQAVTVARGELLA